MAVHDALIALLACAGCAVASVARATAEPAADSVGRPTVGLVLSGGGARGGAHIGVIRVLEELNIPVDFIAGTSMGAVIGGLYAAGLSAAELDAFVDDANWGVLLVDRPPRARRSFRRKSDDIGFLVDFDVGVDSGGLLLPGGLVQGQNLELALRRLTAPVMAVDDFDALPIPFRAVATDVVSGEMVIFDSGDLVTAMRASMAVPGIFKPERVDGRILVDGGIANNLPIGIARDMDADVIIAVDVGFPLQPESELVSGIAITRQMLTILVNNRAADQLRLLDKTDIHIQPPLGGLGSQQFQRMAEAVQAGYQAALQQEPALSRLALTDADYAAYRSAVAARRPPPPVIERLVIENESRLAPGVIEARLDDIAGGPLRFDRFESDIADIYALDTFETVSYRIAETGGATTLTLRTVDKSWGPNFLRFGLNLEDDFDGGSSYNAAARLTMTEINRLGGEFRTELQIGESPRLFAEFFQPLDYASRWFLNPQLTFERSNATLFEQSFRLAEFRNTTAIAALQGGRQLGNWGEFRLGFSRVRSSESLRIGTPGTETDSGNLAALTASFSLDTIDNLAIPRYGANMSFAWNGSRERLGSDGDFDVLSLFLLKPVTRGKNTLLHWWNLDSTVRDKATGIRPFELGGLFSLSGYGISELVGRHRGIGRLIYYRRLGDQSLPGLDTPVYVGASLEAGNVWDSGEEISVSTTIMAGSAFVAFDTLLGPLYLAYGLGEGGRRSAYLFLGQTF